MVRIIFIAVQMPIFILHNGGLPGGMAPYGTRKKGGRRKMQRPRRDRKGVFRQRF